MSTATYIPRHLSYGVAFYSGFIGLSFELIWSRVFGIQAEGAAFGFPMCLALFLLGLAMGAKWARGFCERHPVPGDVHVNMLAKVLALSGVLGWLSAPLISVVHVLSDSIGVLVGLYAICSCAAVFGVVFPLLTHTSFAPDGSTGAKLSYVYMTNIVGSVAGSTLTGFVFFEYLPMSVVATGLGCMSLGAAWVVARSAGGSSPRFAGVMAATAAALVALHVPVYANVFAHLHGLTEPPRQVIEGRSGVIILTADDKVFSNGTYDGQFSTDLVNDPNGVVRPYSISAFHPSPKRMLCIGMASGSWASVLLGHPEIEELVIVEIEPHYTTLLERVDPDNPLLNDPRVRIITDDARRWMLVNDERFDVIVSNTTVNRRAMASALLSVEFLELLEAHLEPGGLVLVNTTGSRNAIASALSVFEDAYAVSNTYFASNATITMDLKRLERTLRAYAIGGVPTLKEGVAEDERALARIRWHFEHVDEPCSYVRDRARLAKVAGDHEPITDTNMGNEWDATVITRVFDEERVDPLMWHLNLAEDCRRSGGVMPP